VFVVAVGGTKSIVVVVSQRGTTKEPALLEEVWFSQRPLVVVRQGDFRSVSGGVRGACGGGDGVFRARRVLGFRWKNVIFFAWKRSSSATIVVRKAKAGTPTAASSSNGTVAVSTTAAATAAAAKAATERASKRTSTSITGRGR
jgi:hypothetical protein